MPQSTATRVNDFTIKIATVNGTGSASANTLLMKSIFRSGIPVMGKNYFPSNIQGLPTWYEIRITRDGYVARSGQVDIMVAMNAETYARDVREVAPGGYLVYDSTWPRPALLKREDITALGVPLAQLCNESFNGVRTRILMKNICYAGVLAALGMVIGAMWNGARAFTATSGPGISLMNEFLGLAYYAEVPAVIFDIQRVGPSTGMPTRTQQGDLMECAYASHGDTRHVCLYPANAEECFYMAVQAFDLAERLQTPVMVLSDLDIGMNDWMCRDLKWDDNYRPDRGKVLGKAEVLELKKFYRFLDLDDDGIPYRTLPGVHPKAAYFTRGSGHTQYGAYTEDSAEYQVVLDRLLRKWATAKRLVPRAVIDATAGAATGIVSVGSCDGAIREAIDVLKRRGIGVDYMRVRSFPFSEDVERFLAAHERLFVVEQNRDAQLRSLLTLETAVEKSKLRSLLHYSGLPISSSFIVEGVLAELEPRQLATAQGATGGRSG